VKPLQPLSTLALFRRFVHYLRPVRRRALFALVLALALPPLGGALLWLVKLLVDEVVVGHHFEILPMIGAACLGAGAAKIALGFADTRNERAIVESIVRDLRTDLYRHLLSLSPGSLALRGVGDALAHLSADVDRAEDLIYNGPSRLVTDSISALFYTAVLFAISWHLTLVALVALPLLGLAVRYHAPRLRRADRITRRRSSAWAALAEEKLGALPIIQAFDVAGYEHRRFVAGCDAARTAELRTISLEARLSLFIESIVMLSGLLVLAGGAYEVAQGRSSLGDLAAFLGSIGALYEPVRGLAKATGRFQRGATGARRVAHILDTKSLVVESPTAKSVTGLSGAIEFRNVTFGYPGTAIGAVDNLSLRIEPGEMVALVGPSGSGKSTLIRLLLRLFDPAAGSILIDGIDIRSMTLASLRRACAVVFQDPHIFHGTIAENIRYGRLDADKSSIVEAGGIAHVDDFADPRRGGWATPVGPHGGWLSGGQRQRLALARALIRTAPILILDEATASVDSETEELIHETVERFAGQRTILIIGHRLSSLRRADRIIVVDRGQVVETGTPQTLLRPGTRYQQLFAAQIESGRPAA
jgi:ATP-binding cassette, subfamily B, bacterial